MYIISVIPLVKIPRPALQTLDYFAAEKVTAGGIVQVSLGSRKILGVAGACAPLLQQKQQIKKSAFRLKKIEKVINKNSLIPKNYLELAAWCANYFYSPYGLVVRSYLPQIFGKPTAKFLADLAQIRPKDTGAPHTTPFTKKPVLYWARHDMISKITFYRHAIQRTFARKQSILFLVPELYKIEQFREKIPELDRVEVAHSGLAQTTQYKIWKNALLGKIRGVMGTRSALAMPLSNLGLIIVDEEESFLYKSFDRQPYTNAKTVALKLAQLTGAEIVLASNLPSVESLWKAKCGTYFLKTAPASRPASPLQFVDMRKELEARNFSILSRELQIRLLQIIKAEKQAVLFINRKGLSSGLVCRDCGHVVKCPNCDVPSVLHNAPILICHHCGQKQRPPTVCPKCESYRIKFVGAGTERVEQEVGKFCAQNKVPKDTCRVARLDTDIAPTWEQQKRIFNDFNEKRLNILIGTQLMLKEGLLPKVDLAAIITIDSVLSLPDFRMGEQLIRIADKLWTISMSPILLQTYLVDNPVIENVLNKNNLLRDVEDREELSLPPFSQLIKLTFAHRDPKRADQEANILKNKLQTQMVSCELPVASCQILGPSPAFIPRIKGRYIWQIVLKSKIADLATRNRLLRVVPSDWKIDVDPVEML